MSCAAVQREAFDAGLMLATKGDGFLHVSWPKNRAPPPPALLAALGEHKVEIIAILLDWYRMPDWQRKRIFTERNVARWVT